MTNSVHADSTHTVRVSARRFEQSPFYASYANDQTVMGVYAGRYYPVANGEDVEATYWALRKACAFYDVPEKPMQIAGPDAVAFLEHVFARRIGSLKEGRGRYAILCTPGGGVFVDGILFRKDETTFWYVQPDGALESWLVAHSAGFDATISDPHSWVVQIQGPTSFDVMAALTGGAIDEGLKYFHAGQFDVGGQSVYVSRTGWTAERGYEIYTDMAVTDHDKLFGDVMAAGEAHGLKFGSLASMEIRRIEGGIHDNITDFDMTMTPFAAGLGHLVDLDKDDFVGREALLAVEDRRPRLLGLVCAGGTPAYRGAIRRDGRKVGFVTAGTWSLTLETGIGYARFAETDDWEGQRLEVECRSGESLPAEIVALPFYDREKRIPRGLPETT